MKTAISIIITTKNEAKNIERCLIAIKNQTFQNYEIIVVDNRSKDQTKKIAKNYTEFVFTAGPERSSQRNYGEKKAKGKYIFFLDADMELSKKVLEECIKKIESDKQLGGIIVPEVSVAQTFWEKVKAFERSFYNESGDTSTDAARFFTRVAFTKIGGYDETITGPEDWDLSERVGETGYKIGRIKSVIYHYELVPSPIAVAKKKYYYGLRAHRYFKKHRISAVSAKSVYFLRPVFYKQWKKMIAHPILTTSMIVMLFCETVGGGLGYFLGKYKEL
jgi:glycosyltransferase involved in cell wall biosynthesis